ncbi:TRAP transporter small permease [Bosea sp. 124]|uniref:TRAP transporter small permease subunit n=1 Tax=Bosea sp. 124 TaxID=2135642 RepID=UPI000D349C3B|nr:TRAP transporter small permease [Bosea sp. 124]PTM42517.1 TRAP-type mannitol/chloroaromatic compound transport system permease small subunit [Bosea sp. 124]
MTEAAGASAPAALRFARALRKAVDRAAAGMAYLAGWNYVLCALFITSDIVGRSAFGVSSAATVEISGYMLACGISWALAHTLAERAHIRVDVLVNRVPLRARALLHLLALVLLGLFSAFLAWAGWDLLQESLMFDAHDNSALHIPMALPQGIWAFGLGAFLVMIAVLMLEAALGLFCSQYDEVVALLGSRSIDDEADEALEAVAMARKETTA